jgi:polysaccharide pyruvyl transferase WcaK-like protein
MRILVEASDYVLRNAGDTAMVHVALARLRALFPEARIVVFTSVPEQYPSFAPDVIPLHDSGRRQWFEQPVSNELILGRLPAPVISTLWRLDGYIKRRWPRVAIPLLRRSLRQRGMGLDPFDAFVEAVSSADLIIATGMGGITDVFSYSAREFLDTFRLARHFGARAAMMGQGIGPLEDAGLRREARAVLPRIDFIGLRESRVGPGLLSALGVAPERMMVTGDDAIAPAYERHADHLGDSLGVNIRCADYAGVDSDTIGRLRPVLKAARARLNAPLVPIPISHVPGEEDATAIRLLIDGPDDVRHDGMAADMLPELLAQIHRCRLVVAGSYHAAVFALASGIPAIALTNSPYYNDKFLGLADQFGTGCTVIPLSHPDLPEVVAAAIDRAWESAPRVRSPLLDAAARQVELSHEAYRRVAALVRGGNPEIAARP